MDPLIPGQGIVCTEEIICLRIFIQDSLFTLSSVQYVYYTNVLCVHVCGRERAFVYICVCVYVYRYVCMYVCMYVCLCVYVCTCVCIYVCMCMYIFMCVCVYLFI